MKNYAVLLLFVALVTLSATPAPSQESKKLTDDEVKALFETSMKQQTDGRHDEAIAGFLKVIEHDAKSRYGMLSAYNIACSYALTSKKGLACEWLEKAVAAGWRDAEHLRQDKDMDSLRSEPRYLKCLEAIEAARLVFSEKEKVIVPFCDPSDATGVPYVRALVGEAEAALLLDTGISGPAGNTVNPGLAPKCKLVNNSGTVRLTEGEGATLDVHDQFFASIKFGGADGVLGFGFFGTVKTTIDYPGKKVEFERYREGEESIPDGAIVIPFRFMPIKVAKGQMAKCPFVDGTINGKPVTLIFDTGTNWSIIGTKATDALELEVKKEKVFSKEYEVAHLDLDAGGLHLKDTVFVRLPHPTLESVSQLTGVKLSGIIGNDILKKYRVTMDYRKMKMILVEGKESGARKEE